MCDCGLWSWSQVRCELLSRDGFRDRCVNRSAEVGRLRDVRPKLAGEFGSGVRDPAVCLGDVVVGQDRVT